MKIKNFLPVCAAILLIAACTSKQDAVFSVNGTKISKATYQGTVDNLAAQYVRVNPNFLQNQQNQELIKKLALEQLITNEVLYQEAKKQNVKADEKAVKQNMEKIKNFFAFDKDGKPTQDKVIIEKNFQDKLQKDGITYKELENNIRKELMAQTLLNKINAEQKAELQEEDLQNFYNNMKVVLSGDKTKIAALPQETLAVVLPFAQEIKKLTAERAQVSAVFLATPANMPKKDIEKKQALAKDIVKDLKANKIGFVQAIAQYSDDKNALNTKGEQLVLRGALPDSLDKKIFNAKLGEILGPLTEKDGIYILRVNEKRAETKPAYNEVRAEIAKYLAALQIKQKTANYVKDLVNKAEIKPEGEAAKKVQEQNKEQAK